VTRIIKRAPVRDVKGQQCPEQPAVHWDPEMQQLMDYHEILKSRFLFGQVLSEGDCAGA
jgi:hypothetical protein